MGCKISQNRHRDGQDFEIWQASPPPQQFIWVHVSWWLCNRSKYSMFFSNLLDRAVNPWEVLNHTSNHGKTPPHEWRFEVEISGLWEWKRQRIEPSWLLQYPTRFKKEKKWLTPIFCLCLWKIEKIFSVSIPLWLFCKMFWVSTSCNWWRRVSRITLTFWFWLSSPPMSDLGPPLFSIGGKFCLQTWITATSKWKRTWPKVASVLLKLAGLDSVTCVHVLFLRRTVNSG